MWGFLRQHVFGRAGNEFTGPANDDTETFDIRQYIEKRVGDGRYSSIVTACIYWIATNGSSPMLLQEYDDSSEDWQQVPRARRSANTARFNRMLQMPADLPGNRFDYMRWQMVMLAEMCLAGEALGIKLRNAARQLIGVQPVSYQDMQLKRQHETYGPPVHWMYKEGTPEEARYSLSDVFYARYDLTPALRATSVNASALFEQYSDLQANDLLGAKLRNRGGGRMAITPKNKEGSFGPIGGPQALAVEARIHAQTSGTNIDKPIVLSEAVDVHNLAESNRDLQFGDVRMSAEARICALYQVNPSVLPLLVGLMHTTFSANMDAARKSAYETGVLPRQRALVSAIRWDLLPELNIDPLDFRPAYDRSEVGFLQERQTERIGKAAELWNSGLVKRNVALAYASLPLDSEKGDEYKKTIADTKPAPPGAGSAPTPDSPPGSAEGSNDSTSDNTDSTDAEE